MCSWDELYWTTDGGETWRQSTLPFYDAETFPLGDIIADEAGNVYVSTSGGIYPKDDETYGIFQSNLALLGDASITNDWELKTRVLGGVKQMEFCADGSLIAATFNVVGYQDGVHLLAANQFAVSDNGIVYVARVLEVNGENAILAYSLDFGEHFTDIGEILPYSEPNLEEADGFFKGHDNYLYFYDQQSYWKSTSDANELPFVNPWIGVTIFDEASGLYYIITSDNTAEVTYTPELETTGFNSYVGDITIPESIDYEGATYTVTTVGDMAFKNCNGELVSVVVPNTVTAIGESAFSACEHLLVVVLPNSVVTIGKRAFANSWPLTAVRLPEEITVLPRDLFVNCSSLTSIEIPSSVVRIENCAFMGAGLTSIDLPESLTHLGDSVFNYCTHLSSVNVPNTVTELGAGAFSYCYELQSVHLPENLTVIPDDLFNNCQVLESIAIPETVTEIGEGAFIRCFLLTEINLPASVTSLGSCAFRACVGLTSYTIPETVRHLGSYLFQQCDKLRTVSLPQDLDAIPVGMFEDCSRLDSIVIPETVASIGAWAFSSCFALKEIVIPDNVTTIGTQAFYDCRHLSRVELGVSVSSIAEGAFRRNNESEKLTLVCHSITPGMCGLTSFPTVDLQEKMIVPCGCENIYRDTWESWQSDIEEDCGTDSNEWYYEILNDDGSITYQYLHQTNATTIDDKEKIHVLVRINTLYDKSEHTEMSHEYIYDEDDIVYWWNKDLQEFTVLYNYNLEPGDEWEIKVGTDILVMHVDAVEQYEYEGRLFKMLQVSDANHIFSGIIVRGIGHLTSFFPEKLMNNGKGYRVEGIRCFWKDHRLMFKYGEKDCDEVYEEYHDYGVEEPVLADGFRVYPNPADYLITISGVQADKFRITNMLGQTLMTGCIDNENQQIDVSVLSPGVYFININGTTAKFVKY